MGGHLDKHPGHHHQWWYSSFILGLLDSIRWLPVGLRKYSRDVIYGTLALCLLKLRGSLH